MKKLLLVIGIILIIAGILSLSLAALNMSAHRHALDGSAEFYARLHHRTVVFLVIGIVLTLSGAVCIALYFKI